MSRQYNLNSLPILVLRDFLVDEIPQLFRQFRHEYRPWSDAIAVKRIIREFLSLCSCLLSRIFSVLCGPESSSSLLIHFRSRRHTYRYFDVAAAGHTIHRHEEEFLGFYFAVEMFNVVEDCEEHLLLGNFMGWTHLVFVRTLQ